MSLTRLIIPAALLLFNQNPVNPISKEDIQQKNDSSINL